MPEAVASVRPPGALRGSRRQRSTDRALRAQRRGTTIWAGAAADPRAPRVVNQGDAAGWGLGVQPGGLARDIMHAAGSDSRPTTPEAVSSANMASMRDWMERVSTSMGMSSSKKSSLTSLLEEADGVSGFDDRPEIYCFSPGRNSVQTLASVLASASAPSIGPGGAVTPQRRCDITDSDQLALQAALEKRVRNANFLRGDCAPRPLSRSGNQLVDATSSRPRGLLDSPAAGGDADRVSFLRANLKPKSDAGPGATAVQKGLVDHAGRVAGMLDRMQRTDQGGRRATLHDTRIQCARGWSSWIVRHAGDDDTGEDSIIEYGPSLTSCLALEELAPSPGRAPSPERKSEQSLATTSTATSTTTAERARKALLKIKAERKQREVQAAAQEEKKKAGMAVIEAAKQREAEAYSRRISSVRAKLSSDTEERKAQKSATGSSFSCFTEQRRVSKSRKVPPARITGPERIKAAQLRYSDRPPQQAETTGGGFYWTTAEEDAIANGSEGEAKAAAHFDQVLARGHSNAHHRYRAPVESGSDSESETDSDSEDEGRKVTSGFKFRDPDAWDRRFESQASAPLKMKDEWYVDGECAALQSYVRRRVVPGSSCVLQIGCGNSNLGEQLHDSCGLKQVINLDLSATVIDQMRAKRPDLCWVQGDALTLTKQFGDAAFDAVIDKGTLQSVLLMRGGIELSQVLAAEIYKVLRPGGRLVCVVGVQPGLAQYLKGPGLRWRISYKTVDGDGRPISIYTLTKPLEEASELMPAPQQCKVDHERKQSSAPQQQVGLASGAPAATAVRVETNAAARALGFRVPQARVSQSRRMRAQVTQKSAPNAAQSRSRQQGKVKGRTTSPVREHRASSVARKSTLGHFASMSQNEETLTSSEDDDSSVGSAESNESEDSSDCEGADED